MKKFSFRLHYNTPFHNKVPAIKILREAAGLGLKEAKDLIDPIFDGGRHLDMVMRADQFGVLAGLVYSYQGSCPLSFDSVREYNQPVLVDVSNNLMHQALPVFTMRDVIAAAA